ncbi:MAG: phytoene/squalene synthase family protein [Cyclobacteriaceae bacterium]|nr:phytoene/squalene synthase family protein [Cyclobacteriaceae bacterium]
MKQLFDQVCAKASAQTTHAYSTSFSLGIRSLNRSLRNPICSIYGFVRFADEIVDTFHDYPQEKLLKKFRHDTYEAIEEKISLNPILNSFQHTVNTYGIGTDLIETFLDSMEMDLRKNIYKENEALDKYILGSAEVVGLMCLKVFVNGDEEKYEKLKYPAMKLGSAFQKVNFLRDLKSDYNELGRSYFPGFEWDTFDKISKNKIEEDITSDFAEAKKGILKLPRTSRFGVLLAYTYYLSLFRKIKNKPASHILTERIRIPNPQKIVILLSTFLKHRLNLHI